MTHDLSTAERLLRWSELNAVLMAMAIPGVLLDKSLLPAVAVAGGSFLGLVLRFRRQWTPGGHFGPANLITLLRLIGALALLLWPIHGGDGWPAGLALAILCADGLDGWAARRWGTVSEFGHLFDQEVDAFFFLALGLVLYIQGHLGAWVLFPGALRYLFVLFAKVARPPQRSFRGNRFTRAISVAAILAFILCLLPVGAVCVGLAAAATLGLCGSFAYSTWRLYRPASGA
jgi:phosphatidylglycerophosphate synthase